MVEVAAGKANGQEPRLPIREKVSINIINEYFKAKEILEIKGGQINLTVESFSGSFEVLIGGGNTLSQIIEWRKAVDEIRRERGSVL